MSGYLLSLISFFVISGGISVLIPKGDMEKYIKFLCGICLICIIADPVFSFIRGAEEIFDVFEEQISSDKSDYSDVFEKSLADGAEEEIALFIENKISEELNLKKDDFDIKVTLEKNGNEAFDIKEIKLKIFPSGISIDAALAAREIEKLTGSSCEVIYDS